MIDSVRETQSYEKTAAPSSVDTCYGDGHACDCGVNVSECFVIRCMVNVIQCTCQVLVVFSKQITVHTCTCSCTCTCKLNTLDFIAIAIQPLSLSSADEI